MVENFENLDNFLCNREKIRNIKVFGRHRMGTRVWKRKEKAISFVENDSE